MGDGIADIASEGVIADRESKDKGAEGLTNEGSAATAAEAEVGSYGGEGSKTLEDAVEGAWLSAFKGGVLASTRVASVADP